MSTDKISEIRVAKMLFHCEAIKIAPVDRPFLYTSGLIGPFYINTHYLCGGKEVSEGLLGSIDLLQDDPLLLAEQLPLLLDQAIGSSDTYSGVLDVMAGEARRILKNKNVRYITGGQRRDWFFSVPLSKKLNLDHLFLFNDCSVCDQKGEPFKNSSSQSFECLHVADLLTVGSSYLSKWIPAISSFGGKIIAALNCVDRNQGGADNLNEAGIPEVYSLVKFGESLFREAHIQKFLDESQLEMLLSFISDPFGSMQSYLIKNPDFVRDALNSDDKSKARICLMLKNDLYKLGSGYIRQFESLI
ncbi:MAG TPA: hypothetical protein PKA63_01365 [Oligoflexia bacterium]|nr:hypothetical protein [Oligoflexia bacterium]HMP47298.1 hypothetical protein [Oligoflexia bacterium]